MFKFLIKGILRDRSRSLLPIIVVTIGVFFVVMMDGLMGGVSKNFVNTTADHSSGFLSVTTRAFLDDETQQPIDLALIGTDSISVVLNQKFPEIVWTPRTQFGGLLDIPDRRGNTRVQGPVAATACDFLSADSQEATRLGLRQAIRIGRMIEKQGEILISNDFAQKYHINIGDTATFFGSTMYGAMTFMNYSVCGTVNFGVAMLDKGAVIMDISDARSLLDMDNAANQIVGFLRNGEYDEKQCAAIKQSFNSLYAGDKDDYVPVMSKLTDDKVISQMVLYLNDVIAAGIVLIVFALALVLWNTGILGGIRRYNEFGVRLAIGEEKRHIYRTLLLESLFIGIIGSILGTIFGIAVCVWIKIHGIDYSSVMQNINMMMDPVIRAEITPRMFFIGFIPGIFAMLLGSALAGRAIYKRQTANLFKELD